MMIRGSWNLVRLPRYERARTSAMLASRGYATAAVSAIPLKLAIVGAGPSGFYTASRILASLQDDNVEVHMYERLPTPYGLVRYGVAPDHPEVKNCQHKFDELAADSRFRFFGNVRVGNPPSRGYTYPHALSLPYASLQAHYNTILLTYGSSTSASLGIPGSSSDAADLALENVHPALDFVSWYNGHPAYADLGPNIDHLSKATVIGHGNVALDCARILLKSPDELRGTDIPLSVLDVLASSKINQVDVVGRRGPGQVAFTTKEFRELLALPHVEFGKVDVELLAQAKELVGKDRMKNRLLGLMEKENAASVPTGRNKHFQLSFLRSPLEFLPSVFSPSARKVGNIRWNHNTLLNPPPAPPSPPTNSPAATPAAGRVVAQPTKETSVTRTDFVIESVGYKSEPLSAEVPFDTGRGRVRNVDGRVVDPSGIVIPGLYAAGWAARGPVGVIASTMHDAYALASCIINDHASLPISHTESGIPDELTRHKDKVVGLDEWKRIDEAEVRRAGQGRVREKFLSVRDMLAVLQ